MNIYWILTNFLEPVEDPTARSVVHKFVTINDFVVPKFNFRRLWRWSWRLPCVLRVMTLSAFANCMNNKNSRCCYLTLWVKFYRLQHYILLIKLKINDTHFIYNTSNIYLTYNRITTYRYSIGWRVHRLYSLESRWINHTVFSKFPRPISPRQP